MENPRPADQHDHRALLLLASRPELFAKQGHVAAGYRTRNGRKLGPYYRLSYREDGRQHSIYLGRPGELVDRVRHRLGELQRHRVEFRALHAMERQVRASLRVAKRHLASLLRPYGLRMKGMEIRGWRFSPLRRFLPRRRCFSPKTSFAALKPHKFHPNREPPRVRLERFLQARDKQACH
jgi:hypothetical protein